MNGLDTGKVADALDTLDEGFAQLMAAVPAERRELALTFFNAALRVAVVGPEGVSQKAVTSVEAWASGWSRESESHQKQREAWDLMNFFADRLASDDWNAVAHAATRDRKPHERARTGQELRLRTQAQRVLKQKDSGQPFKLGAVETVADVMSTSAKNVETLDRAERQARVERGSPALPVHDRTERST